MLINALLKIVGGKEEQEITNLAPLFHNHPNFPETTPTQLQRLRSPDGIQYLCWSSDQNGVRPSYENRCRLKWPFQIETVAGPLGSSLWSLHQTAPASCGYKAVSRPKDGFKWAEWDFDVWRSEHSRSSAYPNALSTGHGLLEPQFTT